MYGENRPVNFKGPGAASMWKNVLRWTGIFIQRFRKMYRTNGSKKDPKKRFLFLNFVDLISVFFVICGICVFQCDFCVCVTDSWHVAYAWLVHVISIWFTYSWLKTAQFPYMFFCMFCNVAYVNYLYCRWFCVCVCFLNIFNFGQFVYAISVRAADLELLHSWFVSTKCLLHLTPLGCLEILIISQSLKII